MSGCVIEEKSSFLMLELSLHNWIGTLSLSLFLKCLQEHWSLDIFYKVSFSQGCFLSLYSNIQPYIEFCYHASMGGPSCYLDMLDKICRTIGLSLAASLELLAYHQNVTSLSLFYSYYFGRCSFELVELVPLPQFRDRSTHYSNRLHDFSVTILWCYKICNVSSFSPCTATNYLPAE